jgi:hypothetical protein
MTYDDWRKYSLFNHPSLFKNEMDAINYFNSVNTERYGMACRSLITELLPSELVPYKPLSLEFILNYHQKDKLSQINLNIDAGYISRIMDTSFDLDLTELGMGKLDLFDVADSDGLTQEFYSQSLLKISHKFLPMSIKDKEKFISDAKKKLWLFSSISRLVVAAGLARFFRLSGIDANIPSDYEINSHVKEWRKLKQDAIVDKTLICKWTVWCADTKEGFDYMITLLNDIGAVNISKLLSTK